MSADEIPPNPAETAPVRRPPRFDAEPFRPDDGAPPGGLVLLLGGVLLTAAAFGFVLYAISQWINLLVIASATAAFLLGGVVRLLVWAGKVRNPIVVGTAAALAGVFMIFAVHTFKYLYDGDDAGRIGNPPANVFDSIDEEAHEGVVLTDRRGRNEVNLGYVGSYLYFAGEALLAAGLAFAAARTVALAPFCRNCNLWKAPRMLAGLPNVPPQAAIDAMEAGALLDLLENGAPPNPDGPLNLKTYVCPRCGGDAPVVVEVERTVADSRGRRHVKVLGRAVYPGEVLALLDQYGPPETRRENIRPV